VQNSTQSPGLSRRSKLVFGAVMVASLLVACEYEFLVLVTLLPLTFAIASIVRVRKWEASGQLTPLGAGAVEGGFIFAALLTYLCLGWVISSLR
jgi:uncharacterized membrane protein